MTTLLIARINVILDGPGKICTLCVLFCEEEDAVLALYI
jgi:hypothetical protein